MSKERIRKLAARYDRTTEEVVAALAQLGEGRYSRPDDQVPEAVVQRLDRVIKSLPRKPKVQVSVQSSRFSFGDEPRDLPRVPNAIPEDPSLNAALQDYLSAKPLDDLRNKLKAKGASPAPASAHPGATGKPVVSAAGPATPAPVTPSQTEAMLRDSLGSEIHKRRVLTEALDAARVEVTRLKAELEGRDGAMQLRLDEALAARALSEHSLRSHIRQLEAERDSFRQQLEQESKRHRDEKQGLEASLHETRRELDSLKVRLNELTIEKQVAEARVQVLERRLQQEEEETAEALRLRNSAVAPAPLFPNSVLVSPSAPEPQVQERGREEVVRQFIELCGIYQIERITVVGGSPRYLQELKALLEPGIELRGVDGTATLDGRRARQHVDGADLTLVWAGSILLHRVANRYTDLKDPRVVLVSHRGLEGMLRQAMEAVKRVFKVQE